MRFKVGDKVRVRSDLKIDMFYGDLCFVRTMADLSGSFVTITSVDSNRKCYLIEESNCGWTDEMFDPAPDENYICFHGKRIDLTADQVKMLGLQSEPPKEDPFARHIDRKYFTINPGGNLSYILDDNHAYDIDVFNAANYCSDRSVLEQRSLHEKLSRKLWRYALQHDGIEKPGRVGYQISCDASGNMLIISTVHHFPSDVAFVDERDAARAIEEIVKPFLKEHPDFIW